MNIQHQQSSLDSQKNSLPSTLSFDLRRVLHRVLKLLRIEIVSGGHVLAGLLFAAPVLFFGFGILKLMRGSGVDEWPDGWFWLANVLVLGLTSNAFARENSPQTAPFYLMIPASHFEKYIAKWLLTFGVGFFGPLVLLTVFANILAAVGALTNANQGALLFPASNVFTSSLGQFALAHAVIFCGSAFFRKHPMAKTIFSVAVYAFAVALIGTAVLASGLISQDMRSTFSGINPATIELTLGRAGLVAKLAFGILCPLFLYAAAYFRLEETEVS